MKKINFWDGIIIGVALLILIIFLGLISQII